MVGATMRSRACWALRIVITVNGARGGEGGGEGRVGGGGGRAGGEGGLGGCCAASTTRLTRRSGGALHARIWEPSLDPPRFCGEGIQIQPLLVLTPLTQLWTPAVTSISNQPSRFANAVAIAGVRYSASLRPCAPAKVRNVVEFALHSFEISCSWAEAPGALVENVSSTLYRSVARWMYSCGRSWFGPDPMMSGNCTSTESKWPTELLPSHHRPVSWAPTKSGVSERIHVDWQPPV